MNSKKRKIFSSVVATTLAAAILLTGTFAWQSISQTAKNEVRGIVNPGGRLHDDFDGKNKDVYVENFTDKAENGVPIFARVKLDEYMEIGKGAGTASATNVEKIGNPSANRDDPKTWTTHLHDYTEAEHNYDGQIHDYWSWTMGGKTVYMPTFNKNKDSLKAEINGTFAGTDGDPATDSDRYKDYKKYTVDQEETADAIYDADDNSVEEDPPVEGTNITKKNETHKAKETKVATVMTMDEWKDQGEKIGDYWVYDKDGWAYWANAIQPGEATGLLLDGINLDKEPGDEYYYAINVTGQFATAGDWGDQGQSSGFYADKFSDDAKRLLNKAAGLDPKVRKISIKNGSKQYAKVGETLTLEAELDIKNATSSAAEKHVTWTCSPETPALVGNKFTATSEMVGKKYTVTATSSLDKSKTATATVMVYPSDASGLVDGELDGKKYIDYGDNTFKEILDDGTLGEFVCAGRDKKIGNVDDMNNVEVIDKMHATFGNKFLGPNIGNTYWAAGADGKLGTEDDIKVSGSPWPENISDKIADEVIITTEGSRETVKVGSRLKFNAEVKLNGQKIETQDVIWSVSGNSSTGTTIDQNGILKVGSDEKHEGKLMIKAVSQASDIAFDYKSVTVKPLDFDDIPNIKAGSDTPITIDGVQYYVLVKNGKEALIWAKRPVLGNTAFDDNNSPLWETSSIRTKLNGEWLTSNPTLKDKAIEKTISTRIPLKNEWKETKDKVFLLTYADVTGKFIDADGSYNKETKDPRDYTYGNSVLVTNETMKEYEYDAAKYFIASDLIRTSPNNTQIAYFTNTKGFSYTKPDYKDNSFGCRPAMWVKFREDAPQGPSKKK